MPYMKCEKCGTAIHYRNKRGFKAPKVCICGGELKKAAWYGDKLKIVKTKVKKGKMVNCAICGRRRKNTGYNAKQVQEDTTFKVIRGSWLTGQEESVRVKKGDYVCWNHQPDYPVRITS